MGKCACGPWLYEGCHTNSDSLECNGPISRRDRKRDIHDLDDAERARIADEAMSIPLASYAYKSDPAAARRRLGFIIDDQPDPSFAVDDDRTHVDLYGYTSMLLATIQQQHEEVEALERRVDALEKKH
jgi:hypothetical protein